MTRPVLPFLETMITQVCNLSCEGCTNYSDLTHSGYVTWKQGRDWLESWLERIDIPDFGIMGGEPLINPEWRDWVAGVRSIMPASQIRFTTNGLLLTKHPDIIDFLHDVGNVVFKITVHTDDEYVESFIQDTLNKYKWTEVTEYGIKRWRTDRDIRFQINRPDRFLRTYQGPYHDMRPWHSNPAKAFDICCQKTCPLMYQGNIYKCSTAGLLLDTLDRFDRPNWSEWEKYLPVPLTLSSSDQDVQKFVDNFDRPHTICGQCPTSVHTHALIDHRLRVVKK